MEISHLADEVIKSPYFQRLRRIKQLGFCEFIFPCATHSRFIHSIGVMHVANKCFQKIFRHIPTKNSKERERIQLTFELAALLHDIGHAPLSHSTELNMPEVSKLKLPAIYHNAAQKRQATHEDYTLKIILDSELSLILKNHGKKYGIKINHIADLILGQNFDSSAFLLDGIDYFPLLHQLISSEVDCDRMDYLLRDSYFCGVSYGQFDLDWLINNLNFVVINHKAFLAINERAISTFDDFLISRYHMFVMVYFHYKSVCLEQMLYRYFQSPDNEYNIPANIEEYIKHDDHFLFQILSQSTNTWAQRICHLQLPPKIFEYFGNQTADKFQFKTWQKILKKNDLDFIIGTSEGRLSKYAHNKNLHNDPIQVFRENINGQKIQIRPINECTDLYEKYAKSHAIGRIHLDYEQLPTKKWDQVQFQVAQELKKNQ